jgi:hypothetical protein
MESAHVEIPIWDGLLLKTGKVEVDSKDKDGRTPLSWALPHHFLLESLPISRLASLLVDNNVIDSL